MTRRLAVVPWAAALAIWVCAALAAPGAVADQVPYTDYAVTGSVGLCNSAGQPVTHGNINDKPFVWRAVSSTAAQAPYDGTGRKATLIAYQPRRGANPNLWSGDTLTSSSTYTNPRYPMAQATARDFSLKDFLTEFPPQLDGMIQLRIYLGAPRQETLTAAYPATDIRVNGDTWTVVHGASVPCTNGSAKDSETLPSGAPASGSTRKGTAVPRSAASTSRAAGHGTLPATGASTSASGGSSPVAESSHRDGSSSTAPFVAVGAGVLAVAFAGAGAYWWRRRQVG